MVCSVSVVVFSATIDICIGTEHVISRSAIMFASTRAARNWPVMARHWGHTSEQLFTNQAEIQSAQK